MSLWRPASRPVDTRPSLVTITDAAGNVRVIKPDTSGVPCRKHGIAWCHRCEYVVGRLSRDATLPTGEPDGIAVDRAGRVRRAR